MTTNTERLAQADLAFQLLAAANYIDALGGDSKSFRAALSQHAAEQAVEWTPGPNVWKDWCSQWFGPDADDDYLAKAIHALPPMAQNFAAPKQAEQQAGPVAWHVLDKRGDLVHAAGWESAAHEHINDALAEFGIEEAREWVVRPVFYHPAPSQERDKVDAGRYRAIRTGKLSYTVKCEKATFYCGGHAMQPGAKGYPEAFDAAVDAAMDEAAARAAGKEQG